jgi:hypothetical protein
MEYVKSFRELEFKGYPKKYSFEQTLFLCMNLFLTYKGLSETLFINCIV